MQNVDGKYVGETSQGPVRIRIEEPLAQNAEVSIKLAGNIVPYLS